MSQMQELTSAERLEQAKSALQAGDSGRARELLQPLVEEEPDNAEAWLWLSGAQPSPAAMAACLRRVLQIEPTNQDALETMAWLESRHGPAAIAAPDPVLPVAAGEPRGASAHPEIDEPARPAPEAPAEPRAAAEGERLFQAPRRAATPRPRAVTPPRHAGSRIYPSSPYARPFDRRQILEYALGVGGVGALLGLLRLAGQLRPGTLLLIRGSDGPIAPAGAGLIALVAAVLHGLALLAVWQVLARRVAAARNDRRGDLTDSLGRTASIFWPGYAVAVALALVALNLGAGERRWSSVVVLVWIILLASSAMAARRLVALYDALRLGGDRRGVMLPRVILPALLVGLLALGTAGLLVQHLLAAI